MDTTIVALLIITLVHAILITFLVVKLVNLQRKLRYLSNVVIKVTRLPSKIYPVLKEFEQDIEKLDAQLRKQGDI